jgi:hypothetical protein
MVIAVLRAGWYRLAPGRRPARAGFAPPARRPAPGVAVAPAVVEPLRGSGQAGEPAPPRRAPVRHRVGFALVVAGAGWSVLSVLAMHVPGGAAHQHGPIGAAALHAIDASGAAEAATRGFDMAGVLMHGPGLVAIAVGLLLVLGRARQFPTQQFEARQPAPRRLSHRPLTPRPGRAT